MLPTRTSEHTRRSVEKEKEWAKDMAAYKRLRLQGLQPPKIGGSHELEAKAALPEHVETWHPEWSESHIRAAEDVMERRVTEVDTKPLDPDVGRELRERIAHTAKELA